MTSPMSRHKSREQDLGAGGVMRRTRRKIHSTPRKLDNSMSHVENKKRSLAYERYVNIHRLCARSNMQ